MHRSFAPPLFGLLVVLSASPSVGSVAAQTPAATKASAAPTAAPAEPAPDQDRTLVDPSTLLGATPAQIFETFGAPLTLHSVRGPEAWQDDVVFVYDDFELYWFRDRVWQARVRSAFGLNSGDSRETALALLGEPLHRLDDAFVYQLPSRAWPLRLRVGFDAEGRVARLFVYRADF